jgi:hypothetical protein
VSTHASVRDREDDMTEDEAQDLAEDLRGRCGAGDATADGDAVAGVPGWALAEAMRPQGAASEARSADGATLTAEDVGGMPLSDVGALGDRPWEVR